MVIAGIWNDGTLKTRILKRSSELLGRIFDPAGCESLTYSSELQRELPHIGGIPEETACTYFKQTGFDDVSVDNLIHIRENQKKRAVWHQKINPQGTYYLISGTKRG